MAPWFSPAIPGPTMGVPPHTVSLGDGGFSEYVKTPTDFFYNLILMSTQYSYDHFLLSSTLKWPVRE